MRPVELRRLLDALPTSAARQRSDRETAARLNWRHAKPDLPPGLELQWLGTAGFRFTYQDYTLLIDPYVSRPDLVTALRPGPLRSSRERISRLIPAADAVLVGHTHFDHALDVPPIAARFGCSAYGSRSLAHLLGLYGLASQAVEVRAHHTYELGPFAVTFVPSRHSKLLLGRAVPFDGELTCAHLDGLGTRAYRCGQVYAMHIAVAGVSFYHQGSADLVESEVRHRDVDFFLAGIAGRRFTPGYVGRMLRLLSPRVVVPQHHDNFFHSLDGDVGYSFNVNLARFPEEVAAVTEDVEVRTLEPLQIVRGS
jgi:L-ascorbate metabolism protein UlaG (beta-lactamase superfamily)